MLDVKKTTIAFDYTGPEIKEISRNLKTLYETPSGSVPLDRSFGLDQEFLGYPLDVAKNMLALEITEKTELYEPRVYVKDVKFTVSNDGLLIPAITIAKKI